jgi:hypothetical protein
VRSFADFLKDKELAPTTIKYKIGLIRYLELRFNLWDAESIKSHIKSVQCSGRRKNNISYAYRDWSAWKGFEYERAPDPGFYDYF